MSFSIKWDEKYSHIIHLNIRGSWLWDEFYAAMEKLHDEIDASSHEKVDFIVNIRTGQMLPQNFIPRMRKASSQRHSKAGTMLIVGARRFPKLVFSIMEKLLPDTVEDVYMVDTMDAAYEILLEQHSQSGK
jgi:hypothetical protein